MKKVTGLAIILVAVLIAVVGYFAWPKSAAISPSPQSNASPLTPTGVPIAATASIDSVPVDWNITSTAMGLTLAYPPRWQITSLRPGSDPQGVNGIEIYNPADDSIDQGGIGITIDKGVSIIDDAKNLHVGTLKSRYTMVLGNYNWSIFIYDDSNTQLTVVVAFAQKGLDVIRVGGNYSDDAMIMMNRIMTSVQ